ncbi:MAG: NADH-dependent [FeFe] hydrogenase, group A6 [Candidatus Auribacterota bacterium]|jgi:NADH-quinone oxidoreductase subunit G|nr:NADH-dependent [FeFe] hydrogenase, group A6 [Candidatus Auribacterota bacterium]
MNKKAFIYVDGIKAPINGERNLLEVIRKANIDIPTFCYHSELSVYGACRMCMVDVEGQGLMASCSIAPQPDMKVKTNTAEIRELRKIAVELLLANHEKSCPTCKRSATCKLQDLGRKLGIDKVRFKPINKQQPLEDASQVLVRDPNKCILCGDCVRMCAEVQGIGAIDFAYRGHDVAVLPAFGKSLDKVECVFCGQCARVCPTGALTAKSHVQEVWKALDDKNKKVVVQIAPAVRVAIGEMFGKEPGTVSTGQIVSALKILGFDRVYDTCFAADLTVIEEGSEFIRRVTQDGALPQFTSCCPGWVKFVEQYYPEYLDNLSTCRSPQQMFGSLAKKILPDDLNVAPKDLVVVSIMPCTAKKFEAARPEFLRDEIPDVDYVLTTQELGQMIESSGINFVNLQPESLDLPLGFKTGAGVIFGNTGGVSEAVLRFLNEKLTGNTQDNFEFTEVRGTEGIREAQVTFDGKTYSLAVVHGLGNARKLIENIKNGSCRYDLIEVMSCPGGCIGGAGQPISFDSDTREKRTKALYEADKMLQLHKSQENPYIKKCYDTHLGEVGGAVAHHLLHTHYKSRKRIHDADLSLMASKEAQQLEIRVCVGTSCYLRGSQDLLHALLCDIHHSDLKDKVDVKATFCFEKCSQGPVVRIGDKLVTSATLEKVKEEIESQLRKRQ